MDNMVFLIHLKKIGGNGGTKNRKSRKNSDKNSKINLGTFDFKWDRESRVSLRCPEQISRP